MPCTPLYYSGYICLPHFSPINIGGVTFLTTVPSKQKKPTIKKEVDDGLSIHLFHSIYERHFLCSVGNPDNYTLFLSTEAVFIWIVLFFKAHMKDFFLIQLAVLVLMALSY